jgi:hypothetical protein
VRICWYPKSDFRYQGITGILDEGLSGLLLGIIYLRTTKSHGRARKEAALTTEAHMKPYTY